MNLLHSHYGINRSSRVRVKDINKLLIGAIKKESEDSLWDRWVRLCPYMELGQIKFISFEAYKKALIESKVKVSKKTSEEIIAELMPVIAAHETTQNKRSLD